MQNNLTPLSTTFFIFALCTSYMFITMNNSSYSYIADYKFILFKILIVISTIALGFFTTVLSCTLYATPLKDAIAAYDFTTNHLVQTFLLYISSIWMALAIALLPFNHTVYDAATGAVDVDRTQQLHVVQQTVYSGPYYMFMILMGFFLFVNFVVIGHTYNTSPFQAKATFGSSKGIAHSLAVGASAQSTFGFYFRLRPSDLISLSKGPSS